MTPVNNRRVFVYSSLFIALLLNIPKLFALRKAGIIAHYWHFNTTELILQTTLNFLFCLCIFFFSTGNFKHLFASWAWNRQGKYLFINIMMLAIFSFIGISLQRSLFRPGLLFGGGVMLRLLFSLILVFIELRIVYLVEETKSKELENEHLRNENLKAGIELLKAQLNPHFFFNALSSLSAIVREDPAQAQMYINHLSKVFRYSLQNKEHDLVPLKEEIKVASSYAQLMKMRYETGFDISINIEEKNDHAMLPHMSLQPLIENAIKHNSFSATSPLIISISLQDEKLVISNNMQPIKNAEPGEGIGLGNLNERYKLLLKEEIEISKTGNNFAVKLPLSHAIN